MSLRELIIRDESGYHVVRLNGLGEVHLEFTSRADKDTKSKVWEASIYTLQDRSGSLHTVLYVVADSRDELIRELDRALFFLSGTGPPSKLPHAAGKNGRSGSVLSDDVVK